MANKWLAPQLANNYQVEVHNLLVALGLETKLRVGRRVDAKGDCGFDDLLAQFEDKRISSTIEPLLLHGITTPQGLLPYIQLS